MESFLSRFVVLFRELLEPFEGLSNPTHRVYWPYLLSSGALAAWVWSRHLRARVPLGRWLFSREVWLHKSALLDYRFMVVRGALGALLLGPLVVSAQVLTVKVSLVLSTALGASPGAGVSRGFVVATFSVLAFMVRDFFRFLVHFAAHRLKALWALHQVHHSAQVLTPFTLHRTHPLEGVLMRTASVVALGLSGGLCAWFFQGRVAAWEILGVDVLSFAWALTGANLRHSQVWLSYGPFFEHLVLSPAQHQVHHSIEPRHYDRNFGEALALWDWLFGTLYVTRGRERLTFGLVEATRNHDLTVRSMLWAPLVAAVRGLFPRQSVSAPRP